MFSHRCFIFNSLSQHILKQSFLFVYLSVSLSPLQLPHLLISPINCTPNLHISPFMFSCYIFYLIFNSLSQHILKRLFLFVYLSVSLSPLQLPHLLISPINCTKTESSASLEEMTLGYRSFWRFGNTVVNSQIRRFNLPTESSPQTHTVYSFPLHFTINVSSSSVTDDDAIESVPFLAVPNSSIQDS